MKRFLISLIAILTFCSTSACAMNTYQAEKENLYNTIKENDQKIVLSNQLQEQLHFVANTCRAHHLDNTEILAILSDKWWELENDKNQLTNDNIAFTNRIAEIDAYEAKWKPMGTFTATAYAGDSITSTGVKPRVNHTIAVDPRVIPYSTKVYVEGYGTYVAEDCGGAIKGNKLDIFFGSSAECFQFGRRKVNVYILQD